MVSGGGVGGGRLRPADLDDLCGLQAAAGCRVPAPGRWGLQHAVGSCWRRGSEADPGSAGPLPQSVLPPVSWPRAVGTGPPVVGAGRRHPRVGRAPRRQHVRIGGRQQSESSSRCRPAWAGGRAGGPRQAAVRPTPSDALAPCLFPRRRRRRLPAGLGLDSRPTVHPRRPRLSGPRSQNLKRG